MERRSMSVSPLDLMARHTYRIDCPVDGEKQVFNMSDINMLVSSLAEDKGGRALQVALTEVVVTFFKTGKIPAIIPVEERLKP